MSTFPEPENFKSHDDNAEQQSVDLSKPDSDGFDEIEILDSPATDENETAEESAELGEESPEKSGEEPPKMSGDSEESEQPKQTLHTARTPRNPSKPGGLLRSVLSAAAAVALFALVLAAQGWYITRTMLDSQAAQTAARTYAEAVDIANIDLRNIPGFALQNYYQGTLDEVIYGAISAEYRERFGITREHIRQLTEHEALRVIVGDVLVRYADYAFGGDNEFDSVVNADMVVEVLRDNAGVIEAVIPGFELTEEELSRIHAGVNRAIIGNADWAWAVGGQVAETRLGFEFFNRHSRSLIVVTAILIAGVLAGLYALNRGRRSRTLVYAGVPCIAAGAAVIAMSFAVEPLFDRIAAAMLLPSSRLLHNAFAGTLDVIFRTGCLVFAIGVAAVLARLVIVKAATRLGDSVS